MSRLPIRVAWCLPWMMAVAAAQSPPGVDEAPPDDIAREVEEDQSGSGDWLIPVVESWAAAKKRLDARTGLSWSTNYSSVALGAALGDGVPVGASGDLSVQGVWVIGKRWTDNPLELRFRARHRHAYGGTAASELGPEIGALWGVVDGFSDSGFEVPDFFFRHMFPRTGIELRYGQMTIDSQFGGHQLASSKKYFLNQAFSSHPAIAFPRFGAGLTLAKKFDNGLSIGVGSTTVQGTQHGEQVDLKFGSGDLFEVLQFSYDYQCADGLPRRISLLGWHSDEVEDATQPEGEGVQLIYEQELGNELHAFASLGWSEGGAAPLDWYLGGGLGRPWRDDDYVGIATGIGRGSDPEKSVQSVVEAFYRWKPGKGLTITPDLQLLVGEGFDGGPGVRLVGGVRLSLSF